MRIFRIEQNGVPYTDSALAAAVAAGKGGLWIQVDPPTDPDALAAFNRLPQSTRYAILPVSWDSFSGTFAVWPIDPALMCDTGTPTKQIHALGIGVNNSFYPLIHNGVDFYVPDVADPNDPPDVAIKSMSPGIVAGIGKTRFDENDELVSELNTHGNWGAANQFFDDSLQPAYSVIIRHGHLYVLYGHLRSVPDNIWVGAFVGADTVVGHLGKFNERHLHVEVRSYGESIDESIPPTQAAMIGSTGILPVDQTANAIVAPYVYDVTQFLPNPPGYNSTENGGLSFHQLMDSLSIQGAESRISVYFPTDCSIIYRTLDPAQSNVLNEVTVNGYRYRGFDEWGNRNLLSPLTPTEEP